MRKLTALALLAALACPLYLTGTLAAEPLILEQPEKAQGPGTLELGLGDIIYQNDAVKLTDSAGTVVSDYSVTATVVPVTARLALNDVYEVSLAVPYNSVSSNQSGASVSNSAMADASAGIKYTVRDGETVKSGFGLALSLPTGDKKFREGMNIRPFYAYKLTNGRKAWLFNLAYNMTGDYNDVNDVKSSPGDILSAGIGIEKYRTENFTWITEFLFSSIGASSFNSASQTDSSGSRMDWSLGARYNTGDWKTKLGVVLALGDEAYRTYDYKVVAGVTYLLKI